jgi:hypothetical protein
MDSVALRVKTISLLFFAPMNLATDFLAPSYKAVASSAMEYIPHPYFLIRNQAFAKLPLNPDKREEYLAVQTSEVWGNPFGFPEN